MIKNKEWLIEEVKKLKRIYGDGYDEYTKNGSSYDNAFRMVLELIEELDKPEKLYTAVFAPAGTEKGLFLYKEHGVIKVGDNMSVYNKNDSEYHLTEQEIKDFDLRYFEFAEEVPDKS